MSGALCLVRRGGARLTVIGCSVAVALKPEFKALGLKHVGVVLCGGNIDLDTWRW